MADIHVSVLQSEVLKYLDPKPNENFIDCTINSGGHAFQILEKVKPRGKVLGIDLDEEMIRQLKPKAKNFNNRIILVCDNFANLKEIAEEAKFSKVSGILLDLGFSSWHLQESGRGFSFQKRERLDMRYNSQNPLTAEKIVNYWSEPDIEKILREYGEEQFSKQIAKGIVEARKLNQIKTTFQLSEIVSSSSPPWYGRKKINPATKTFQALRIAVNDELNNLKKVMPKAVEILKPGGRLAIISFHSLEDRLVKSFFRENAEKFNILTKKPIVPTFQEIKTNPRSRSAKMRAIQKI